MKKWKKIWNEMRKNGPCEKSFKEGYKNNKLTFRNKLRQNRSGNWKKMMWITQ